MLQVNALLMNSSIRGELLLSGWDNQEAGIAGRSLLAIPFLFIAGDYYCGAPGELDQDPDEGWVRNLQEIGRAHA